MRDQDEIYEAATEEPATLGCPSLVPGKVVVHDEPGVDNAELQRKGEQLKACNDRSYAKMVRIAELANECVLKTTHAEYAPGQYGQDYREFGKTMCEIRDLVGKSLSEPFAQGEAAGADKAAKQAKYNRDHFSFCDGLFPIRFTNTEDGQMASCWINGRRFTLDLDNNERDDGGHDCAAIIRDNGKVVATIETQRGKSISGKLAFAAFKAYVMNLSGSGKFSSRGGFLKISERRATKVKEGGEA